MNKRYSPPIYVILAVFASLLLLSGCSQPQTAAPATPGTPVVPETSTQAEETTQQAIVGVIDQSDLINLMLDLEDRFKLQDVFINQSGTVLIVRFKAPTITGEELDSGLAQIFSYLDEKSPDLISELDLVFMVQNVDSLIVNVKRSDIRDWKEGVLNNVDFIKKFKKTSLL